MCVKNTDNNSLRKWILPKSFPNIISLLLYDHPLNSTIVIMNMINYGVLVSSASLLINQKLQFKQYKNNGRNLDDTKSITSI